MKQKLVQRPTNKVAAGVLAGAITAIVVWCVRQFAKIEVPAEVAMAITTVITFIVQQYVVDAEPEPVVADGEAQSALVADTQPLDRP